MLKIVGAHLESLKTKESLWTRTIWNLAGVVKIGKLLRVGKVRL